MKMFTRCWVLVLAVGLLIGLSGPPREASAGDLLKDTKTVLVQDDQTTDGDDVSYTTDGVEGDPDTMTDDLHARGSDLYEAIGLDCTTGNLESSLEDLLQRMIPWLGILW